VPLPAPLTVYARDLWAIDLDRRQLRRGEAVVPVGGRAFEIIEVLVRSAGDLVTKRQLMDRVWPNATVEDNTLQVHIAAVRRALGTDRGLLKTVSGRGYRLVGAWAVQQEAGAETEASAPPAVAGFHSNLPFGRSELIGRSGAVQQLPDLISAYRLVTLTGPGGIGKTALATHVGRALCPAFEDNVQLVELASIADPALVPSAIAGTLGLHLAGTEVSPLALARAIGGQTLLLVLDNCEHVIEAAAGCAEAILRHCGGTTILATSREVLRIDGEFAYRVAPLGLPPEGFDAVDAAAQHSAILLFEARMRAGDAAFTLNSQTLPAAVAICRRLDGIPLAIELAAARAATLGIEEVVVRLDDRFGLLTGGRRTALPRHRTLRAMLDWSYDLLPAAEQAILRRLAVFAGGFTLEAACRVAWEAEGDADAVVDGIVSLASKSLVSVDALPQQPRHFLLETVRAYALARLVEAGEETAARLHHAGYFQGLFAQAEAERISRQGTAWLALYGREIDNVRTAIDWAFGAEGFAPVAVELTANAVAMMFDLSLVGEGRRRAEQALAAIGSGVVVPARREMQLLAALQATRIYTDGPSAAGRDAWERVLAIASELGDRDYEVRALWGLWNDHLYGGQPADSLSYAYRFLNLSAAQSDGPTAVTATILGPRLIGTALHYCGEQIAARPQLEHVLAHYVRSDHRWRVLGSRLDHATVTRATLARVLWLQGYPDQALGLAERAMQAAVADGHLMSILYVLVEAAVPLSLFAGDLAATRRFLGILLEQAPRAGFRIWQTYGRCFQAWLNVAVGERVGGLATLVAAVEELEATGFCAHLTMFLGAVGQCQASAGLHAEAIRTIERALERCESQGEHLFQAELLRIKAEVLLPGDRAAEAAGLLRSAMDLARQQGARLWELRAATSLARLMREIRPDAARAVLAPVYGWFTEGFGTADLREAAALLRTLPEA